jgi:hypothetical protein
VQLCLMRGVFQQPANECKGLPRPETTPGCQD